MLNDRIVGKWRLALNKNDPASWSRDPPALPQKFRPGGTEHKSLQQTSMDHIKGGIGKVQWLENIHQLKAHILQPLRQSLGGGIFDHRLVHVNPYHTAARIGIGNIKHPCARATGDIQDGIDISMWQFELFRKKPS